MTSIVLRSNRHGVPVLSRASGSPNDASELFLYVSEEEKRELAKLSALERESMLNQRFEQRHQYLLRQNAAETNAIAK